MAFGIVYSQRWTDCNLHIRVVLIWVTIIIPLPEYHCISGPHWYLFTILSLYRTPIYVIKNEQFKLYFDQTVLTDWTAKSNRLVFVLVTSLIDIAIPMATNFTRKYTEKVTRENTEKYTATSLPGPTGHVRKYLVKWLGVSDQGYLGAEPNERDTKFSWTNGRNSSFSRGVL